MTDLLHDHPSQLRPVRELFNLDVDMQVPVFEHRDEHVPDIDPNYCFNPDVTLAILAGFTSATAEYCCRACMVPASPPISSRWLPASTGPACGSIWTATSAAWIWWARTP
ncbi:hypothetical protein MBH78_02925 [Oceanimonas sp. NS1]|nr:hypothetical protein [Oceanimonas sp. NS1]